MEFFPTANDTQRDVIKHNIEECDYYIVIVAGRYRSPSSEGISYTQKEYEYAVSENIPVVAFLHKEPGKILLEKSKENKETRKKLEAFRSFREKRLCQYWTTADDLAGKVLAGLDKLRKAKPGAGWIRADQAPDESASKEILRLRKKIDELELQIQRSSFKAPEGTENLQQGDDTFTLSYTCEVDQAQLDYKRIVSGQITPTWNKVFSLLSPGMLGEAGSGQLKCRVAEYIENERRDAWVEDVNVDGVLDFDVIVNQSDFDTIIIQLRSLV